jgi:hypothetical protein
LFHTISSKNSITSNQRTSLPWRIQHNAESIHAISYDRISIRLSLDISPRIFHEIQHLFHPFDVNLTENEIRMGQRDTITQSKTTPAPIRVL